MRVAIIGAGNVGPAVARGAKSAGHEVVISDKAEDDLMKLRESLGVDTTTSNSEAAAQADITVLALPFNAALEVISEVVGDGSGKTIIDATNPVKDDYSGLLTETGPSGAEQLQEKAPGANVVKAFNTVLAANQDTAEVEGVQLDGYIAGDDDQAKNQVRELLEGIGFRVIDTGPLTSARYLESLGFLNILLNSANGWAWQSGWKLVGPTD